MLERINNSDINFERQQKTEAGLPILKVEKETIQDALSLFEDVLKYKETAPEWENAFYEGLGEILSADLFSYEEFSKFWGHQIEKSPAKSSASKFVLEALRTRTSVLTTESVEEYFNKESLGSVEATASMLRELDRLRVDDFGSIYRIVKEIIKTKLDQLATSEELKKVFAKIIVGIMRDVDLRMGSYIKGETESDAVIQFLSNKTPAFDFNKLMPIWKSRISHQIIPSSTVGLDIKTALQVERLMPGAMEKLIEEFGIKNPGRYPSELLLDQIKEAENTGNQYEVYISSEADWNSSLHMGSEEILNFYKQLKEQGIVLRIAEVNSTVDIYRSLRDFDSKYGSKILFGLLSAHGNERLIRVGGEDREENNQLNTIELGKIGRREEKAFESIKDFFVENPTLILESCITGADDGVGQMLSSKLHAQVIAPIGSAKVGEVKIAQNDKGWGFEVKYRGEEEVGTAVFVNGEKLVA